MEVHLPMEDKKKKQINENVAIIILKKRVSKQMTYKVEQIESYIRTNIEYMEQLKLFFFESILQRDSMLGYWSLFLFFFPLKLIKDNLY